MKTARDASKMERAIGNQGHFSLLGTCLRTPDIDDDPLSQITPSHDHDHDHDQDSHVVNPAASNPIPHGQPLQQPASSPSSELPLSKTSDEGRLDPTLSAEQSENKPHPSPSIPVVQMLVQDPPASTSAPDETLSNITTLQTTPNRLRHSGHIQGPHSFSIAKIGRWHKFFGGRAHSDMVANGTPQCRADLKNTRIDSGTDKLSDSAHSRKEHQNQTSSNLPPHPPGTGKVPDAASSDSSAKPPRIETQSAFRKQIFRDGQNERLMLTPDGSFRFIPIVMNGDCGFAAVAKGYNMHAASSNSSGEHMQPANEQPSKRLESTPRFGLFGKKHDRPKDLTPREIRRLVAKEVGENRAFYEAMSAGLFSDTQLTTFIKNVERPGMGGHWLGAEMGGLEFVAVARALSISLAVYCFDVPSQTVRRFEEARADAPKFEVCIFFTGPAGSGHFDLLWREQQPRGADI